MPLVTISNFFYPTIHPFIHPSTYRSIFLSIYLSMALEIPMKLRVTELDFPEKNFLPQNLEKWTKNKPKTGFFEFIDQFCHWFLLNLFCDENLCYLLCSCTSSIFGKILVSEIWAKMFSANQIAGFFNQPYLQNKSMK